MGFDDAPPLAKLILAKIDKLDDYQKENVAKQLEEEDDDQITPSGMTIILRSVGITSTASQLRAMSTYLRGSMGGIPKISLLDLVKMEENLDADDNDDNARHSRNSAELSYEMLQRLQGMRGETTLPFKTNNSARPTEMRRSESMDSVSSDIGVLTRGVSVERLEFLKQATLVHRDTEQQEIESPIRESTQSIANETISPFSPSSSNQHQSENLNDHKNLNETHSSHESNNHDKENEKNENHEISFQIQIKTLTGKAILIEKCRPTDTIIALKHWIDEKEGIPPDQQRLLLGSMQLENDQTLASYRIDDKNSNIALVVRSRNSTEHHRRWSSTNLMTAMGQQNSLSSPTIQHQVSQPIEQPKNPPLDEARDASVASEEVVASLASVPRKSREFGSNASIQSAGADTLTGVQANTDRDSGRAETSAQPRLSSSRPSGENWFMKDRHASITATSILFDKPKFFKVLSVAFVQGRPELDGDVQAQLEAGSVVKATARRGDWMNLVAQEGEGEHWLYTGKQRSMDLLLAPLDDVDTAEKIMLSQWSDKLTTPQPSSTVPISSLSSRSVNNDTAPSTISHRDSKRGSESKKEAELKQAEAEFVAPRGVISLAFTDIQGSTRLWERFGENRMKALLDVHNGMMRKCLRRHRGYEVKTEGDAFMISFQQASQAVGFAADVQARLHEAKWPDFLLKDPSVEDLAGVSEDGAWRGLRVRIGIHTGPCLSDMDPTTKRIDYFGHAVNLAARVESQAEGGEVVISQSTYDEVMGDRDIAAMKGGNGKSAIERMVEGLEITCRGPKALKGIKDPIVCWRILPKGVLAKRADSLGPLDGDGTMVVNPVGPVVAVQPEKEVSLTSAEELCNEAVALHGAGNVGEAIILYRKALEMTKVIDGHASRDPTILFNLGAALQASGDTDGAVGCFATILDAIDPEDSHARVQLAVTYHHAGHFNAAVIHYLKALPLLGEDPETMVSVLVSLGEAQRDNGDINAAIGSLSQACRLNPDDELVLEELKRLQAMPPQPNTQQQPPPPPHLHPSDPPPPYHTAQSYHEPHHHQPIPHQQSPSAPGYATSSQPPPYEAAMANPTSFGHAQSGPPLHRHQQVHQQQHHIPLHKRLSHEPAGPHQHQSSSPSSSDRTGKAFGRLGQAVAKWERDHPLLQFKDFAETFDASRQGNLSQSEILKMLSKMKSATKLTEKDLNLIWNHCEQYFDKTSGSEKINLEEMLTVMGSFEIKNLQQPLLFGGQTQEDELLKIKTGKKRLSTFAAALSHHGDHLNFGSHSGFGTQDNNGGGYGRQNSIFGHHEKPKAGGGMAKLMGKSSNTKSTKHSSNQQHHKSESKNHHPHQHLGRTANHTDRPLWPAERAREKRNSMLRSKLKQGREVMKIEEEKARLQHMSEEQRINERIEAERIEAEKEEAARVVHEREARAHAAASARVAERNIEVAARRERLEQQQHQPSGGREESPSQYEKWARFYEEDGI